MRRRRCPRLGLRLGHRCFGRLGYVRRRRCLAVDRRRFGLRGAGGGGSDGASRRLAASPASSNDLARIACTSTPPTPPLPRPAVPAAMPASSNDLARIACTSTPGLAPASDRSARLYDRRCRCECWPERCSERDFSARARPAPSTKMTALPASGATISGAGVGSSVGGSRLRRLAGARRRWPRRGRPHPLLGQSPEAGNVLCRRDADIVDEWAGLAKAVGGAGRDRSAVRHAGDAVRTRSDSGHLCRARRGAGSRRPCLRRSARRQSRVRRPTV